MSDALTAATDGQPVDTRHAYVHGDRVGSRHALGCTLSASCPAVITEGARVPAVVFKCRVRDESIGGDNPFTVSLSCTCSSSLLCGRVQQDV